VRSIFLSIKRKLSFRFILLYLLPFPVYEDKVVAADLEGIALVAFAVLPGGGLDPAFDIKGDAGLAIPG